MERIIPDDAQLGLDVLMKEFDGKDPASLIDGWIKDRKPLPLIKIGVQRYRDRLELERLFEPRASAGTTSA